MIVYKDCVTFTVMGEEIHLYSEELEHGRINTVAEFDEQNYHYMGDEPATISTAVYAWQEVHGRDLTGEELRQVMLDNKLIEQSRL